MTRDLAVFGKGLKELRKSRKMSQSELAEAADISSRHVSFIETGKSRPSLDVIVRLSDVLDLSFRRQNSLLSSAGYFPKYRTSAMDSPQMTRARGALERILERHDPFPAFVTNSSYDLIMLNKGAMRFMETFVEPKSIQKYSNLLRMLFAEDAFHPYVENSERTGAMLLAKARSEARADNNDGLALLADELAAKFDLPEVLEFQASENAMAEVGFTKDGLSLSFFRTTTIFTEPLDVSTQELRIEQFFPNDDATEGFFGK